MLRPLRDAHRDGDLACRLDVDLAQSLGEPSGEPERVAGVARRHDHAELLAADAADDVGAANGVARDARDLNQHLVADAVAVHVVDALEVVEVEHQHGDRVVRARCARQLCTQALVEVAVVVETGERVGLREMLEARTDLRVVERERRGVAERPREMELVLGELGVLADPVDVERALERAARDQRDRDHRLGLDRRARHGDRARIEVGAVRPHGPAVLDRPAGDSLAEAGPAAHDLVLVHLRASLERHEHAPVLVGLVDVQRLVRHQVAERDDDAVEEVLEALLGEHLVEHLGETTVRLGERLRAPVAVPVDRDVQLARVRRRRRPRHHAALIGGGATPP